MGTESLAFGGHSVKELSPSLVFNADVESVTWTVKRSEKSSFTVHYLDWALA
jgi:hypothetical protein